MIGAHFYLDVYGKDGAVEVTRYCELPFPPRVGDLFTFDADWDGVGNKVESVTWVKDGDGFVLWIELRSWQVEWDRDQDAADAFHGCECEIHHGNCCMLGSQLLNYTRGDWELSGPPRYGSERTPLYSDRLRGSWTDEEVDAALVSGVLARFGAEATTP